MTGLSSQSPSPVFHPNLLPQGSERTPPNSPIIKVNTPSGIASDLIGTRFDPSNNVVTNSGINADNNIITSNKDSNLSASINSTVKVSSSLIVSTGSGTVLAGGEIPAYVIAGVYNAGFHVGSNTTDNPNVTKILEVSQSLLFYLFYHIFIELFYCFCFVLFFVVVFSYIRCGSICLHERSSDTSFVKKSKVCYFVQYSS